MDQQHHSSSHVLSLGLLPWHLVDRGRISSQRERDRVHRKSHVVREFEVFVESDDLASLDQFDVHRKHRL